VEQSLCFDGLMFFAIQDEAVATVLGSKSEVKTDILLLL
jgi:hypothetical protein